MTRVIATRTLYLAIGSLPRRGFDVRVFQPIKDSKSWRCRYEIDWPGRPRQSEAYGVDGVQALALAMQKIGAELYTSPYHEKGQLVFDKAGNGYGFPVPKPLRDLLVGDDAESDGN